MLYMPYSQNMQTTIPRWSVDSVNVPPTVPISKPACQNYKEWKGRSKHKCLESSHANNK